MVTAEEASSSTVALPRRPASGRANCARRRHAGIGEGVPVAAICPEDDLVVATAELLGPEESHLRTATPGCTPKRVAVNSRWQRHADTSIEAIVNL